MVSHRWRPGRPVALMLALLVLAFVAAVPLLDGYAARQAQKVAAQVRTRDDGNGSVVGFALATRFWRSRYSRPSVPFSGGNYTAPQYTQPLNVSYSSATGAFTKSGWYFGGIPSRRYDVANTSGNDFKPANSAALTTALAGLSGKVDPIIELTVGQTYTGNFSVPAKNWTGTLIVRSGSLAGIPNDFDAGAVSRVGPSHVSSMATITQNSSSPCWSVMADCDDVWHEGLNFIAGTSSTNLILAGHPNNGVNTIAKIPARIAWVHNVVYGNNLTIALRGLFNETYQSLVAGNYMYGWRGVATEAQAYYCGGYTLGQHDVVNNFLEGGGQCLFYGGGDTVLAGTEIWPSDIYIARNFLNRDAAWRATSYQIKVSLEIKKGERILMTGNIIEGCWGVGFGGGAQSGAGVKIVYENTAGANPNQQCRDITFRYNIIRKCGGMLVSLPGENFAANFALNRVEFSDTLGYDLNMTNYELQAGKPIFAELIGSNLAPGPAVDFWLCHNTCRHVNAFARGIETGQDSSVVPYPLYDRITLRDNIIPYGTTGGAPGYVRGDSTAEGVASIVGRWTNYDVQKNLFHGSTAVAASYPGQYLAANEAAVGYVNVGANDYSITPGSLYSSTGAKNASDGRNQGADTVLVLQATANV